MKLLLSLSTITSLNLLRLCTNNQLHGMRYFATAITKAVVENEHVDIMPVELLDKMKWKH